MVTLKDCTDLTPNFSLPNTRLGFDTVRPAMPVPLSVDDCGLVAELSKIINFALRAPTALGVNATPMVHEVLGATMIGTVPHVPVPLRANSAGSDDVAFEMNSGLVAPVLLIVRFFASVWPTATLPKASDAVTDTVVTGVAVAVGVAETVEVEVVVAVEVAVDVGVAVEVAVAVKVAVAVGVAVAEAVGVAVRDVVAEAVAVGVAVGVAVAVDVEVAVAVGVAVAEGAAVAV